MRQVGRSGLRPSWAEWQPPKRTSMCQARGLWRRPRLETGPLQVELRQGSRDELPWVRAGPAASGWLPKGGEKGGWGPTGGRAGEARAETTVRGPQGWGRHSRSGRSSSRSALRSPRRNWPCDTQVSDFWPPELRGQTPTVFSAQGTHNRTLKQASNINSDNNGHQNA